MNAAEHTNCQARDGHPSTTSERREHIQVTGHPPTTARPRLGKTAPRADERPALSARRGRLRDSLAKPAGECPNVPSPCVEH